MAVRMLHAQLVQQIRRVKARIVRQLPRDNFERLGVRRQDHLLLALDRPRMSPQHLRQLHLNRTTARHDIMVLDRTLHNHNRIVETALNLRHHLLRPTPQNHRRTLRTLTLGKQVEALSTHLALFKQATRAQMARRVQVRHRRLDRAAHRLHDPLQIIRRHTSRTKDIPVSKVLRRQVANRQLRQHHLRTRLHDRLELAVDNRPLRIDNRLVLRHLLHTHFRIVLLRLQLQFHIQAQHLRVHKLFRLLLKARVRKRLFERHTPNQHRVLHSATRHLFDPDQLVVEIFTVQRQDRIHSHLRKKGTLRHNQLGRHGRAGTLEQQSIKLPAVSHSTRTTHSSCQCARRADAHALCTAATQLQYRELPRTGSRHPQ